MVIFAKFHNHSIPLSLPFSSLLSTFFKIHESHQKTIRNIAEHRNSVQKILAFEVNSLFPVNSRSYLLNYVVKTSTLFKIHPHLKYATNKHTWWPILWCTQTPHPIFKRNISHGQRNPLNTCGNNPQHPCNAKVLYSRTVHPLNKRDIIILLLRSPNSSHSTISFLFSLFFFLSFTEKGTLSFQQFKRNSVFLN